MSKGIVEETVYVFLFRCEKCNRPIISWMLSPRHGGFSLEKAQTKALPLTCVMKECGWSEARFGRDAIESWAVPWTDRKSTRLNSSHEWISYAVFCLKKKKKERL